MTEKWRIRQQQLNHTQPGTKVLIRPTDETGYYAGIHIEKTNKVGDGLHYHVIECQNPEGNWTYEVNHFFYLEDVPDGEDQWAYAAIYPGEDYDPEWRDKARRWVGQLAREALEEADAKIGFALGQMQDEKAREMLRRVREQLRKVSE